MQAQYRQYTPQQVPQRSPHAPAQRRGGIGPMMSSGPHPSVPLTQAQIAQQQQAQAHATELARRRSRKPTDKNIPDGVEDFIVDAEGVQRYRDLRDVERRLDCTITRKRLDIMDATQRGSKLFKTLRIWITNTVEDQVWQGSGLNVDAFDFTPNTEASYRVKIEGLLLPDENNSEEGLSTIQQKFSDFFKAITVERTSLAHHEQILDWKKGENTAKSQPNPSFDEFTFKRNGDETLNITIHLHRQEAPVRYELSPELAEVTDMRDATQQEAVMGMWEYIRHLGLQEDEEKRNFRCDELLKRVVKRGDTGHIPLLKEYITPHLRPLPPVSLAYTIRVDEEFHKSPQPTVYDIQVSIDDPLRAELMPLINNPQYALMLKEVTGLDEQLSRLVQALAVSKTKHSFFSSLSTDPTNFIRNWLSSQKRDLEVIMGEATRGGGENVTGDEWRRGGKESLWTTRNAQESVNVLLSKQR